MSPWKSFCHIHLPDDSLYHQSVKSLPVFHSVIRTIDPFRCIGISDHITRLSCHTGKRFLRCTDFLKLFKYCKRLRITACLLCRPHIGSHINGISTLQQHKTVPVSGYTTVIIGGKCIFGISRVICSSSPAASSFVFANPQRTRTGVSSTPCGALAYTSSTSFPGFVPVFFTVAFTQTVCSSFSSADACTEKKYTTIQIQTDTKLYLWQMSQNTDIPHRYLLYNSFSVNPRNLTWMDSH